MDKGTAYTQGKESIDFPVDDQLDMGDNWEPRAISSFMTWKLEK